MRGVHYKSRASAKLPAASMQAGRNGHVRFRAAARAGLPQHASPTAAK